MASHALGLARTYASKRVLYGEAIVHKDAIAEHLLRMQALERAVACVALRAAAACTEYGQAAATLTAVAKLCACALAEEVVTEGAQVLGGRSLVEDLPYARIRRDVLLFSAFDGTRHVMLAELEGRLEADAYRWKQGEPAGDTLDAARAMYSSAPEPLVASVAKGGPPQALSLPEHLSALATLSGSVVLSFLPALATSLYEVVVALRTGGAWTDQAVRFEATELFALTHTLAALVELGDPERRAALGASPIHGQTDLEGWTNAHALGLLAARVASRLRALALRHGVPVPEGVDSAERGALAQEAAVRGALRGALRTGV
jgi:hypothetical protein